MEKKENDMSIATDNDTYSEDQMSEVANTVEQTQYEACQDEQMNELTESSANQEENMAEESSPEEAQGQSVSC